MTTFCSKARKLPGSSPCMMAAVRLWARPGDETVTGAREPACRTITRGTYGHRRGLVIAGGRSRGLGFTLS